MKKNYGFTLIELMITLFIVGILLAVGVPSLKTFMQGNQLIAASNDLWSALNLARSEAFKQGTRVSICDSSNGTSCGLTGDWSNGWIVFVDAGGNLVNTGAPCTAPNTDCLLRVHEAIPDGLMSITGLDANNAAITSFTFTAQGRPKNTASISESGTFSVCSFDSGDNVIGSRAVVLSLSGRARVSDNAAVISCPANP